MTARAMVAEVAWQVQLDELLAEQDAKGLLVIARSAHDSYLLPFIGATQLTGALLVAPRGGPAKLSYMTPMERDEAARAGLPLTTPEDMELRRLARDARDRAELLAGAIALALQHAGMAPGCLALAGHASAGLVRGVCAHLERDGWSFVPGEPLVDRIRKRKNAAALAEIRRSASAIGAALRVVAAQLVATVRHEGELWLAGEPLTVGRLRRSIMLTLAEHGLDQPAGNIVAPAEEGAVPHSSGSEARVLHPEESLVVDLFPRSSLFADCTRTFCVGRPPEALAHAHTAVGEALELSCDMARPGVRGWSLQEAVCKHFAARGYATPLADPGTTHGYVHGLGHGVGYELHELPNFRQEVSEAEGLLEEGDVLTLEPGLYAPDDGWAVRLEDTFLLGPDGPENLTPFPHDLDPRVWQRS